jgi:hypothetical protein
MFYYLHEKYNIFVSTDLSRFKGPLSKIESIHILFIFLWFRYIENQNCALMVAWMSSGAEIVVDEYNY